MSRAAAPPRALARFELLRELGRGAQAIVWLAQDPRLDREVAVKLLTADADADTRNEWLNEARAVSRLKHPNVVPVFEADEHQGQPYLVFEYVEGPTLQEVRRKRAAMPAREAVTLMLGVLDALAAAHEQGIVHRDLKPSNVLIGGDGRPRVMDFGIAARVAQGDGRIVGTPGYISPEAARGEAPHPAMDVFSAGVMLGELLAGAPLMRETDPRRAVARVQQEDMLLPASLRIDDTLRGIVQRALARDVAKRYDSARSMHAALSAWLNPEAGALETSNSTLEFLLRRMRHKTDCPALSSSVIRLQRLAASDTESLASLTEEILKDVSLTNKLLRMVNTVRYASITGGGISTVSRAVALVGFAGIRNMALSVLLLEHMGDKGHAAQMKEEFLRALMAGTVASDLTSLARESEDAFLTGLFQNLGRLLTEFYFPEEALQIRQQLATAPRVAGARESVARKVLGLGLDDLGAGVAKAWGLPETMQRALRVPEGEAPPRAIDRKAEQGIERLRWLARGANALTDAMLAADGNEQDQALLSVAETFAPVLGLKPQDVVHSVQGARTRLSQMAQAMGLQVTAGSPARRLLQATVAAAGEDLTPTLVMAKAAGTDGPVQGSPGADGGAASLADAASSARAAQDRLSAGLAELREAVRSRAPGLNEVLHLVLATIQQSLDMRRVVFCLREPRSGQLQGRLALGAGAAEVSSAFRIPTGAAASGDLFAAVCAKGADLLISDSQTVASRLPAWYRQSINAPTFLLLPLHIKGAPIGVIYADKAVAGSIVLGEAELGLLRQLRDEALAVFGKAKR